MNIPLFRSLFRGRNDCYLKGGNTTVKATLTDELIQRHIIGKTEADRIGIFPLVGDKKDMCYLAAIDIDECDISIAEKVCSEIEKYNLTSQLEKTKSGHFHIWFFFAEAMPAAQVRQLLAWFLKLADVQAEIFPKQDSAGMIGNGINLPLFRNGAGDRTVFVDPVFGVMIQWDYLAAIQKICRLEFIEVLSREPQKPEQERRQPGKELSAALKGVNAGARNSEGFKIACYYYKKLPNDIAWQSVRNWNGGNKPPLAEKELRTICDSAIQTVSRERETEALVKQEDKSPAEFFLTDIGNGQRLVYYFGEKIRHCAPNNTWYIWTGNHWQSDDVNEIENLARQTTLRIIKEAELCPDEEKRKKILEHAIRTHSIIKRNAMIISARSEAGIPILLKKFDADPNLLNVQNGAIDLRTGDIYDHSPDRFLTKITPVGYYPEAKHELWDSFLATITDNDEELLQFLQRAVGYSLTGRCDEEKLFFIHGDAGTGKSTFIEAIKGVMGNYSTTTDFETFIKRNIVGGVRNDIASLAGARLVISIEVDEGKRLAQGLIKTLTGGDTIWARFLYQEGFEFLPQLKLWLVANHAPKVRVDDEAMWRRVLRIPFSHVIPEVERDPQVKYILRNDPEAQKAILAWAVQGCIYWMEKGLCIPQLVKKATADYRAEMDDINKFISECCNVGPDSKVKLADFHSAFVDWSGEKYITQKAISKRLEELGYKRIHDRQGNFWDGIELKIL